MNVNSVDSIISTSQRHDANIYYKHNFGEQAHFITLEGNLIKNRTNSQNNRQYSYMDDYDMTDSVALNRDESPFSTSLYTLRTDYYRESNNLKFESGIRFQRSVTENDFSYQDLINGSWITDTLASNDFNYRENNYIAYFRFGHQINNKFSYSLTLNNIYV